MPTSMQNAAAPSLLLINPWNTDFAAYDFWSKPLGLLYLAAVLGDAGARVHLIDCMDRSDAAVAAFSQGSGNSRRYGTGKYLRRIIDKPDVLRHVPRHFARYGLPLDSFRQRMREVTSPAAILVTSGMTYWYPGVQLAIAEARRCFPGVPVLLGGIYATLLPEHAQTTSGADVVIAGEAEHRIVPALLDVAPQLQLARRTYTCLDDYPSPAWQHYRSLSYGIVMTSRGCPLRCSFCASNLVSGAYRWRSEAAVVDEVGQLARRGVTDIAFYDDALLTNHRRHLRPILAALRQAGWPLRFHTPNGLQCKFLDAELAAELRATGFRTMRLSLESIDAGRQKQMSKKVNGDSFARAAAALHGAGFALDDLDAYVMMALPGQPLVEVLRTMAFVHSHKIGIRLASYSPIPGTADFQRAVEAGAIAADADPLLTNNSLVPVRAPGLSYACYDRIALLARQLNQALRQHGHPLEDEFSLNQRLQQQFSRDELHAVVEMPETDTMPTPSAAGSLTAAEAG